MTKWREKLSAARTSPSNFVTSAGEKEWRERSERATSEKQNTKRLRAEREESVQSLEASRRAAEPKHCN